MAIFTAALAFFLQADGGAGTGAPTSQGFGALAGMMSNIGPVAIFVLVLLLLASLYSWMVILGKISAFSKATTQSRKFIRAFRKATRLNEIAALTSDYSASPLAQVFEDVYETYKRQTGGSGPPRNLTPLERTAQTAASTAITTLERRMTWLATIGATSPFVGLFGTVMGVVDAFQGLGTAGTATLRAVAPGIAEALITTAAGLFVAVPAVVAYNQFSARIRLFASATDDFCRELLNSLEEMPSADAGAGAEGAGRDASRGRAQSIQVAGLVERAELAELAQFRKRFNVAFSTINGQTRSSLADINITPLVDVVLVLLVIFMITEPVLQSGIEVNVPKTRTVKQITEQRMVVTIDRDQNVYLNDQPVNVHDLPARLHQAGVDPTHQAIYLRSDERVPFGAFASVMDAVKQSGITNVSIVTQPLELKGSGGSGNP